MSREHPEEFAAGSTGRSGRPVRRQLARLVTEVLAPPPVTAALLIVIAFHSAPTAVDAFRWALLTVLFVSIAPLVYILDQVRRRRLTDHHIVRREQRPLPMLVGVSSVLIGLALLVALGAPRELVALVTAMTVGLGACLAVTLVWKISVHTATVAGVVVILTLVFGPAMLVFSLFLFMVGWARVELRKHTLAQVIAGSGLGAVVAAVIFELLR